MSRVARAARAAISAVLACGLAACGSGPRSPNGTAHATTAPAAAPAITVGEHFRAQGLPLASAAAAAPARSASSATAPAATEPPAWWQAFHDPVLDGLQAQLLIGNDNIRSAVAQVAAARAVLGGSRAAQGPSLSAGLGASRADSGAATGQPASSLQISATAAWEWDLWGRLGQATQVSQARLQASEQDLAAVRLSAQATLNQSYFALRAAEITQALTQRSLRAYQRSLELTQARLQAGVASPSDVLQAQTQLKTTEVQALEAGNQRAQLEHAIAVLLGQSPSGWQLAPASTNAGANAGSDGGRTTDLPQPPAVPELLPSRLIQRRPDIAAAAQRVEAARAQIGVADAAFFPSFSLSATPGLRGSNLADWFNAPVHFWSIGAALAQKLWDGGALDATKAQAVAATEQAGAAYCQSVLQALQEVEDNLVLAHQLQAEVALQAQALDAAQRNQAIAQTQYEVGTVSYLNVVTAQATALASERSMVDLRQRHLNAVNQLLKNLAGSW